MIATCNQCDAFGFAWAELEKGDEIIHARNKLLTNAIRTLAGLYHDGILARPEGIATISPISSPSTMPPPPSSHDYSPCI